MEYARLQPGDEVENAVKINVAMQVQQLQNMGPVLTKAVQSGQTQIVGAVYDLETGKVEFLNSNYLHYLNPPSHK